MLASATWICKVYRFYKLSAFANSIGHPGKNTKNYIHFSNSIEMDDYILLENFSLQIAKPLFYLSSSSTFFVSGFVAAVNIDVVSWKRAPLLSISKPFMGTIWGYQFCKRKIYLPTPTFFHCSLWVVTHKREGGIY